MRKIIFNKIKNKGQSLVEVVVACGIIGIISASMMGMLMASKNLLYQSEDKTKATTLSQEGIEIVRHQRDIGCSFSNIVNPTSGELISNDWIIWGDLNGGNMEDLFANWGDEPNQIRNFDGFSRYITIKELTDITSDEMDLVGFNTNSEECSDVDKNYDCLDKYYFVRVDVHKGDRSGPIVSQSKTILSKQ
ncbi:MAG: prepilin-type N-terminal cleavage/methylation domain-containing protein [Patescibacteria group bacterium]